MLLTIYNLPPKVRYQDIKTILTTKCGLNEFILDNLTAHTLKTKKVTVGLPEEEDAALVMRKINGHNFEGNFLVVELLKKKPANNEDELVNQVMSTYNNMRNFQVNDQDAPILNNPFGLSQQPTLQQPYYQQAAVSAIHQYGFGQNSLQQNHSASYYFGTGIQSQNVFANYGHPQQMASQSSQLMSQSFGNYNQEAPLGFGQPNTSDVWLTHSNQYSSGNVPGENNHSQRRKTKWDNFDNNASGSRDAHGRDRDRNTSSNSYGREPARPMRRPPGDWRDRPGNRTGPHGDEPRAPASNRRELRDLTSRDPRDYMPLAKQRDLYKVRPKQTPQVFGKHVINPYHGSQGPRAPVPRPSRPRNRGTDIKPREGVKRDLKEKTEQPAKRPREEADIDPSKPEDKPKDPKKPTVPSRAVTWRAQLASAFAREILNNPENKTDLDPELVLIELKAAIRNRLALLVGTDYEMRMNAMGALYKLHYSEESHRELFAKITADMNKLKDCLGPVDPDGDAPAPEQPVEQQPVDDDVMIVEPEPPSPEATGPAICAEDENADKYKNMDNEQNIFRQLDETISKAMDDELDEMFHEILEEFEKESDVTYKGILEEVKNVTLTLKQVIKSNITKRYLNIGPIVVRIFATPKICKTKLAPVLEAEGITNLCKTSKCYIGMCQSYEELDRLCAMKTLVVENSSISMKPYHLTGKKKKVTRDDILAHRKAIADSFTKFAQTQEKLVGSSAVQSAEDKVVELSEDNAGVTGDGATDEGSCEQSKVPVTTNVDLTENDSNSQNDNQNDEKTENDEESSAIVVKQENAEEEIKNEEDNEQLQHDKENIIQEGGLDTNTQTIDENNMIQVKQENDVQTEENTVKEVVSQDSKQLSQGSDDSVGNGELNDIKDEGPVYPDNCDDIDMHDLNEDDLEDW
ncbi:uncharacterized protein LOC113505117 isoform X2 [Trichoplusia ni]|uniref:Uncharacterized protein LOC113505117 isoform X2 n=1 Tax=Trichoplusia ni TaxID=7111 RepID=A0A7E5WT28_TRINI|nr:uncharacterized protein LOC113505117 isoform X2 [Trichoplusia ni]